MRMWCSQSVSSWSRSSVFMGPSHVEDPEQLKYLNILFDFAYLKNPEDFENMVNSNTVRRARSLFAL